MQGSVMLESLSILALFSVWNLLILAAMWRVSVRAVERARRDAIVQTASTYAAQIGALPKAPRKPRAPKVTA
jgi:hypothetical protein